MKLENNDEEHVNVASALSWAEEEDTEMDDAHDKWNVIHPYFESIVLRAREDHHADYDKGQLAGLASDVYDNWSDFCLRSHIPSTDVPPPAIVNETFLKLVQIHLSQAQIINDFNHQARAARGSTVSTAPDVTWFTGVPCHGGALTSPSPPLQGDGGVLDVSTPPLGDSHGWTVMGGKKGCSFASIVVKPSVIPGPAAGASTLPLLVAQAVHGFLMKPQLDSLTQAQVINAYNAHFTPKLGSKVPKDNAVATFLDKASHPIPTSPPLPKAVTKAEYTLVYDARTGDLTAPSGRWGDAASYVCSIQAHVWNVGLKQAELIGSRWTSQTSRNFVLMFNGNPSLDEVLRLCSIFTKVFGPHYSIVPSKGYT